MDAPRDEDRRQHERKIVVSQCKIRDRRGLLFSPGQTSNVSEGGALVRVDRVRPFDVGDQIQFVMAPGEAGVLKSSMLVDAVVRRVIPIDYHHQALALQFVEPKANVAAAA